MTTDSPPIRFAAIVVMAGSGRRFGGELPKVFVELAGEPMWTHTVRAFAAIPGLTSLVLVTSAERVDDVRGACPDSRVIVVAGGAERQDSVRNGLAAVAGEPEVVAVHDAARPLIRSETAARAILSAAEHGSGLVAVPVRDTVKEVEAGVVTATPDRSRLWRAQTPQCFRIEVLREAHERARASGVQATDDAALVELAGHPVHVVRGDEWNLKITEPGDLLIAESVLARRRAEDDHPAETTTT